MNNLSKYLATLRNLLERTHVALEVQQEDTRLFINGIEFRCATSASLFQPDLGNRGVMLQRLSPEQEAYCRAKRISYLTIGKLWLSTPDYTLDISGKPQVRKQSGSRPSHLSSLSSLPPTLLISPNGLAILDTLFRLSNEQIGAFQSALSFAHEYRLSQPKISQICTRFKVKSLLDFKVAIKSLSDDWWLASFRYPMTRKRLTPFFSFAKPFHSLLENQNTIVDQLKEWKNLNKDSLAPGPVETMRNLGFIRDPDIFLWGLKSTLHELKREFRLVPGVGRERLTWYLATPVLGMDKESILSQVKTYENLKSGFGEANVFRAIWDLGFGDERLREIQITGLRKILE